MKITGHQAKEILGITSASTISRLMKAGVLHDLKQHNKNCKKIFPIFDSAEVNKVAKVYSPRMNPEQILAALQNGHVLKKVVATKKIETESTPTVTNGIITRLDRIEQMLEKLLRMWS